MKIRLITVGEIHHKLRTEIIEAWKSDVFKLTRDVESLALRENAQGQNWEYPDAQLERLIPERGDEDILFAIMDVDLENSWYSRRLRNNRIVLSLHDVGDILYLFGIPTENLVLRVLYAYSLVFLRNKGIIPTNAIFTGFTHDETRGCLYDMNPNKIDVRFSTSSPRLCDECTEKSRRQGVSDQQIALVKREIVRIKRPLYFRISDKVKAHPVLTLIISLVSAFLVSLVASLVANVMISA